MTKFLFLVFVLSSGAFAHAQNVFYDQEAYKVCKNLTFESEVTRCMDVIKNNYFDSTVVSICNSETFSTEKIDCLGLIANKRFISEEELSICRSKTFSSEKNRCLRETSTRRMDSSNGQSEYGYCAVSRDEARDFISKIDDVIYAYRRNDIRTGERILESLRREIYQKVRY